MRKLAIIDAGHGGVTPGGTYSTAPAKQHRHSKGQFHIGSIFCEGAINRTIASILESKLRDLQIPFITLYDPYADLPLRDRVKKANYWSRRADIACGVSIHANASPAHNARGSEVFTTPGETDADTLASLYFSYLEKFIAGQYTTNFTLRTDVSDRDADKEARLYMLTQTHAPFMLIETLFFDQYDDAVLLMRSEVQELFADACAYSIHEFLNR